MFDTNFKNKCLQLGLKEHCIKNMHNPMFVNSTMNIHVYVNARYDNARYDNDENRVWRPIYDGKCQIFIEIYLKKDVYSRTIKVSHKEFMSMTTDMMEDIYDHIEDINVLSAEFDRIKKQLTVRKNSSTMKRVLIKKLHSFEDMLNV
jgi:hypothetical protein